jgi:hypothetical protein
MEKWKEYSRSLRKGQPCGSFPQDEWPKSQTFLEHSPNLCPCSSVFRSHSRAATFIFLPEPIIGRAARERGIVSFSGAVFRFLASTKPAASGGSYPSSL